jgi:lysyl-tRNA synthetase class II
MASLEELREERLKKKALLQEKGFDPYPNECHRTDTVEVFLDRFSLYENGKDAITLAGRIMSKRGQGAITFCDIFDGTARVQILLKKDEMDEALYNLFQETIDVGDFIEATGIAYTTEFLMDILELRMKKRNFVVAISTFCKTKTLPTWCASAQYFGIRCETFCLRRIL